MELVHQQLLGLRFSFGWAPIGSKQHDPLSLGDPIKEISSENYFLLNTTSARTYDEMLRFLPADPCILSSKTHESLQQFISEHRSLQEHYANRTPHQK
jgi:hypothetical protein